MAHEDSISIFHKGMPISAQGASVANFLSSKPNLFTAGFQFPIMVLRDSALEHNIQRMASYCKSLGFELAPHVKTPMSPQIAQRQIAAGAWGLTIANFNQARIMFEYGFKRLIIGNEVMEPTSIAEISKINGSGSGEIIFYIDSLAGLKIAQDSIAGVAQAKLNVFMEIGAVGGRAGIRDLDLLKTILSEIAKDERIFVRGVSGFEGAVPGGDRAGEGIEKLRVFLRHIVAAARITAPFIREDKIIISAGGSSFFDYVAEEFAKYEGDAHRILRSGGYVSHDHIHYEDLYPFMGAPDSERFYPALELWARVLSVPEPDLAILNFGKRDAGNDLDEPLPISKFAGKPTPFKGEIEKLNDQHAFMKITPGSVVVGDIIGCGISHPCTNFDKWRLLPLVNDNYDVIDLVHTHF
ncbi:MAG: alanine racemase [Actinobacteria bacterium]|nr:alanine racemase [Actinomycetota bacterium]